MQKIQLEKSLSEEFIFYAISTLTIAIQFLFYLIHSPRLAMMDVGGWMFYITAACSHAAVAQKTSVIRSASCLPYYFPLTATRLMMKLGVVSSKDVIKMNFNNKKQSADLNYPIDSLKYEVHSNPKNVVLIAIDSWNYRAFNQDITPHISHFADSCS